MTCFKSNKVGIAFFIKRDPVTGGADEIEASGFFGMLAISLTAHCKQTELPRHGLLAEDRRDGVQHTSIVQFWCNS